MEARVLKVQGASTDGAARPSFISELHGVRGIALALVVLFHVFGQGRVSGGVDVFLFFSGFLLTASMFRRASARTPGSVRRHYVRTVLRLLPAAVVVLVCTTAVILLIRPLATIPQDLREVRASLLYVENWELISSQLAYGAAGPDASPLQHFWSLSLQGQFFLGWPWLVLLFVAVGHRIGRPWPVCVAGVAAVTGALFVVAQTMVAADQQVAYFHGASRWWELTAGGLLALVLVRLSLPRLLAPLAGWAGVAIIVASGFVVDGAEAFPGPWVLLPLSGAALVLAGAGAEAGPRRLLQTRPLTWLADIAYELYLWHWPVLVLVLVWQERVVVGPLTAVAVLGISTVLAWLTHLLVSRPFLGARGARPRRVLVPAVAVVLVGATVLTAMIARGEDKVERALDVSGYTLEDYPGAEAVRTSAYAQRSYALPVGPPLEVAASNTEPAMGSECWQDWRGEVQTAQWCGRDVPSPSAEVVLVGGSRAVMWQPALMDVAERNGWDLKTTSRGSCPLQREAVDELCRTWSDAVVAEILERRPDAVFVEGTEVTPPGRGEEFVEAGRVLAWGTLREAGIEVFALRAGPRFEAGPPDCLLDVGLERAAECSQPASGLYAERSPVQASPALRSLVHEVDVTPLVCPGGTCSPVIGNLVSFRDRRHFTAAFARTLGPAIEEQVGRASPRLVR